MIKKISSPLLQRNLLRNVLIAGVALAPTAIAAASGVSSENNQFTTTQINNQNNSSKDYFISEKDFEKPKNINHKKQALEIANEIASLTERKHIFEGMLSPLAQTKVLKAYKKINKDNINYVGFFLDKKTDVGPGASLYTRTLTIDRKEKLAPKVCELIYLHLGKVFENWANEQGIMNEDLEIEIVKIKDARSHNFYYNIELFNKTFDILSK